MAPPGDFRWRQTVTPTWRLTPNFAPTPDFQEWDHIAPNVTFQIGQGTPRPTYPIRFGVPDLEAERERILREAQPAHASPVKRFEGLVAVCDFVDPWGNTFGLYQVLFEAEPPVLTGSLREHQTDIEAQLESQAISAPQTSERDLTSFIDRHQNRG